MKQTVPSGTNLTGVGTQSRQYRSGRDNGCRVPIEGVNRNNAEAAANVLHRQHREFKQCAKSLSNGFETIAAPPATWTSAMAVTAA